MNLGVYQLDACLHRLRTARPGSNHPLSKDSSVIETRIDEPLGREFAMSLASLVAGTCVGASLHYASRSQPVELLLLSM